MDRVEAIEILAGRYLITVDEVSKTAKDHTRKVNEALDLAIEALSESEIMRCKDCRHNNNCDIQFAATAGENFGCLAGERNEYVEPTRDYEFFGGEYAKECDAESATTTDEDDCISRQAAIKEIALHDCTNGEVPYFTGKGVQEILKTLPQVTPTEKHEHGRLIDADALTEEMFAVDEEEWTTPEIRTILKNAPNITPPERTGEWIDVSGSWCANEECSLCGEIVHEYNYNYCPNCGAKMKG